MRHPLRLYVVVAVMLLVISASSLPYLTSSLQTVRGLKNSTDERDANNVLVTTVSGFSYADGYFVKVERNPPGTICSLQPVHLYIVGANSANIQVDYRITVETNPPIPGFESPRVLEGSTSYSAAKLAMSGDILVSSMPGLPSLDVTFTWTSPIGEKVNVTLIIRSQATINVSVGAEIVYNETIAFDTCNVDLTGIPFALAFSLDSITSGAITENLGLSTPGWVAYEGDSVAIWVLALDDNGLEDVVVEYSVNGGDASTVKVEPDPITKAIREIVDGVNVFLENLEGELRQIDPSVNLPRVFLPIFTGVVEIPPVSSGSYVLFKARARDVDGNTSLSPEGIYYTTIKGGVKVLIVDPSLRLWLLRHNLELFSNSLKASEAIGMPSEVRAILVDLKGLANRLSELALPPFRNWQAISGRYEIMIAMPESDFSSLLASGSFEPEAIILSNLFLGVEDVNYLDWDLRYSENLDDIIGYVKERHAGIIVTHGSLSDWVIWTSCDEDNRYRVAPRGHTATSVWDLDMINERTLAAVLGLPEITLWEIMRDYVAEGLCSASYPEAQAAGRVIGSIPLVLPYIPFSGRLQATEAAEELGFQIPQTIEVKVPGAFEDVGFDAYTSIGWQLALPRLIAGEAFKKLPEAWDTASQFYSRLATFLAQNLSEAGVSQQLLEDTLRSAFEGDIAFMRNLLTSSTIEGSSFYMSFTLEGLGVVDLEFTVPKVVFKKFLPRLPVELVAISDDYLAAIIVHDKYWDPWGYRAVYFTFEPEATDPSTAEALLSSAIEWALQWKFEDIVEMLGDIIAPKGVAEEFKNKLVSVEGYLDVEESTVLNEEGFNRIELRAPKDAKLNLIIAHPTTESLDIELIDGPGEIVNVETSNNVTLVEVRVVDGSGSIVIGLQASSDSSINPVYVEGYTRIPPETVTVTETTTTTTTTTVTETTTETVTTVSTTTTTETLVTTTTTTTTYTVTSVETTTETVTESITITETIPGTTTTVTVSTTVTKPVVETRTTTATVTVTERAVETIAFTETAFVTVTETQPYTRTIFITVTPDERVEATIVTSVETLTETVTVSEGVSLSGLGVAVVLALIIGLVGGYILRRPG
ncbi:MAG: hypothetical protein F7B17_04315 [Desulfurococcales archaeon]|nr:hypothetical protein [Desulfurococcales archaeon]